MRTGTATLAAIATMLGCSSMLGIDDWETSDAATSSSSSSSTASSSATGDSGGRGGGGEGGSAGEALGGGGGCGGTTSDPENCGRCGVSCLGGRCEGGVCQPLTLSVDGPANHYQHVALDDTYVYWSTFGGPVLRLEKTGPGLRIAIVPATYEADMLVAEAGALYWSSFFGDEIGMHDGTAATTLAISQTTAVGITLSNETLYWGLFTLGTVQKLELVGGNVEQASPPIDKPYIFAHDDADVFFTFWGPSADTGGVADIDGTQLVTGLPDPGGIAVGAMHVYFTTNDGGLYRVPKAGGALESLVPPDGSYIYTAELALDADHAYWVANDGSLCSNAPCTRVKRLPLAGGSVETFAEGDWENIFCMAIDDEAVYWTTHDPTSMGPTRLMRKAKQ